MVGAVIVKGRRIVGEGYHRRAGEPHAEILAIRGAADRTRGATLYVTLEPCCHTGKRTPPCVPAVLDAGFQRIVVAMPDPNPSVRRRGIARLRRAGLDVHVGCLEQEARRLNEAYIHWMTTGRPFVILKGAMTLDGKIATAKGESRWITGEAARRDVHRLRNQVDAIIVGVGTVSADDPELTVRYGIRRAIQPRRVILDSRLRLPVTAKVLTRKDGETIVATTARAPKTAVKRLQAIGATVWTLPEKDGRVSMAACLTQLGRIGVTSVLIEGGSEVAASAFREGVVDRVRLYVAPALLGGDDAKDLIGGPSPARLSDMIHLEHLRVARLGSDLMIEGDVRRSRRKSASI